MICGSVLYNVGCGRESGDVRIDNIKERSTLNWRRGCHRSKEQNGDQHRLQTVSGIDKFG